MPAAPAAPAAPPPSAPAQPAPSAPSPVTPTKETVVAPPKTAPATSGLASRPSRRGVAPPKETPNEPTGVIEDAFSDIKKLGSREDGDPMDDEPSVPAEKQHVQKDEKADPGDEEQQAPEKAVEEIPVDSKLKTGDKKPNPWTLVNSYKSRNNILEKEVAELRSKSAEPPKELTERLSAIEKRNQELENHIRFVDYSKSQEFVDKYQKPYEDAWARAITGLKGLKISLGTDQGPRDVP